jgi:type I restriction enzyme S subunit
MGILKNIPSLRFHEFEGEWKNSNIEDYFEFKNGLNKEKDFFGRGTPIINFTDVYKLIRIREKDIKGLVELTQSEKDRFSAKIGDVFFTRTSETIHDIGMTATLIDDVKDCVFSGFVLRARPKSESFVPDFTSYLFSINSVRKEIVSKSSMTTRALTSGTLLNKVSFKFPISLKEQTKIATFLTAVDDKIQALKQKKTLLEQYKKGVMQKIFSQELQFKDDNGNDYPDWEEKKLREVANKKSSNISANKIEDNFGDYIIYGASGILKKVDFYKEEDDYISIIKDGAGVGRLLYCKGQSSVLGTMEIIRPNEGINTYYLYCLLSNIDFVKYVTGSTIPHIYFKDYSSEICGIPCLEEQTKIAHFLSAIDEKIKYCQEQIINTEVWKKGLLQQMFC